MPSGVHPWGSSAYDERDPLADASRLSCGKPAGKMPNAGRQARLEAAARNERRLEGVACTPLLGAGSGRDDMELPSQPYGSGAPLPVVWPEHIPPHSLEN